LGLLVGDERPAPPSTVSLSEEFTMPLSRLLLCVSVVLGGSLSTAWGQGLLIDSVAPRPFPRPIAVPTPTLTYQIQQLSVRAKVIDQVATVQIEQTFQNTGSQPIEAQFVFPLPAGAAVEQLTLLVNGRELPGQLMDAKEARRRYEAIVRSQKDPALLEWLGNGLFQTSVFPIPAQETRLVQIRYTQLLPADHGVTDFLFPLATAKYTSKPIDKLQVHVTLETSLDLKNVYSPTHPVDIQRPTPRQAVVQFQQTSAVPGSDFRLLFDVGTGPFSAKVLTYRPDPKADGYYLLLAQPPGPAADTQRLPKTVLFVVDKSGSMAGKKMEQAQAAVKFVLNNLQPGDTFNVIAYDNKAEAYRPELERFTDETRAAAVGYVSGLFAGGGTNIHEALTMALKMLPAGGQPAYVLFVTDGLPTVGITSEPQIAAAVKAADQAGVRLLPFGVGYDVNSRLLDRLARAHRGSSTYVRPEEDLEAYVSSLYRRIASPWLQQVEFRFEWDGWNAEQGPAVSRQYPGNLADLFTGEPVVIVGRYRPSQTAKLVVTGKQGNANTRFEFPAEFVAHSPNSSFVFIEKLWAQQRIAEIIDELDLNGTNEELTRELVELSKRYGILTPYTSFLADETRPDNLTLTDSFSAATSRLERLSESLGRSGVAQRGVKLELRSAPATPLAAGAFGGNSIRDIDSDEVTNNSVVRNNGDLTVYSRWIELPDGQRQKRLVAPNTAELDLAKNRDKVKSLARYTDEYFELVNANSLIENQLLSQQQLDEELLIELRGQVYLIEASCGNE
jgi:Ca-activated chloride channel homolog